MTTTKTVETHICDHCRKNEAYVWDACMECGKDCCHTCKQSGAAVEYSHAVYFQGSGDGHYCKECDEKLTAAGTNVRHRAYLTIKALREEYLAWGIDFKARTKAAEEQLKCSA
jgi:hypothetical protein